MKKFTLLELLIIVAILAILMTLLAPSIHKARLASKTQVSMTNLKQIYTGTMTYSSENSGWMCLVADNPHHSDDLPNWRVLIYEVVVGKKMHSDLSPRKEEMASGSYRDSMYCPVILQDRGGYPSAHGEGRGHYGMNKYFGWNPTDDSNTGRGYKHVAFAALENDKEPFLMPTKKSGNWQKSTSGHKLGNGKFDGGRSSPEYIYTNNKSFACFLGGSMSFKTIAWGASMHSLLDNEENFE
ncbi:MAG: type II secretion system GspH family protein [Lentisphaerales bacterium]|nr:type II secretion system GspH family protein [Lentisphaerales bacterium]